MQAVTSETITKLLEFLGAIRKDPQDHYALHYHLSKLQEQFKSPYQIKIATNILADLFKGQQGHIYVFEEGDVVVCYHGNDRGLLEKAIFQLRYLFMDDPLSYNDEGFENDDFCSVYDLEFQWRDFFNACKRRQPISANAIAAFPEQSTPSKPNTTQDQQQPEITGKNWQYLTPQGLADTIELLETIDTSGAIAHQSICAVVRGNMQAKSLFHEFYNNIDNLQILLDNGIDLRSNRPLFKYLTEALDKRLLGFLAREFARSSSSVKPGISVNINTKTLTSEDFSIFDSAISPKQKSSIILEINIADVFEDIGRFVAARQTAQELGYRICLDGLEVLSLQYVDRNTLGFDLAKVRWNQSLVNSAVNDENAQLKQAVKRCGPNRVILCHCDNQDAVNFGHSIGISLFQGRHLDELIAQPIKAEVA